MIVNSKIKVKGGKDIKQVIIYLFIILLYSCSYNNKMKSYCYRIIDKNNEIKSYMRLTITHDKNYYTNKRVYYDLKYNPIDSVKHIFEIDDEGMYKVSPADFNDKEQYLVFSKKDSCVLSKKGYLFNLEIKNCFMKKIKEINIDNRTYKNAIYYTSEETIVDGIKKKILIDNDYALISEEYISGYKDYYRIERIASD